MIPQITAFDPRLVTLLLTNPAGIFDLLDPAFILFSVKTLLLILTAAYFFFCLVIFVQIRRLENWLPHLKRYSFSLVMVIQLIMVAIGWLVAFFIL